jgi:hypothetical protein
MSGRCDLILLSLRIDKVVSSITVVSPSSVSSWLVVSADSQFVTEESWLNFIMKASKAGNFNPGLVLTLG